MRQFFVCVLIFSMMMSIVLGQTNWVRYENNPVLDMGPAGSWDDYDILTPTVLEVDDTLRMWYAGCEDGNEYYAIGYAWSLNGETWTKSEHNPVLDVGVAGSWDAKRVTLPEVLYQDGEYIMYYAGRGFVDPYLKDMVGLARASDPIHWEKDYSHNPIFVGNADGSWDDKHRQVFQVEYDGSEYTMWYSGRQYGGHFQIGRAFSADGVTNWEGDINNPIITNGPYGAWDYQETFGKTVCYVGELVEIFYTGSPEWAMGLATSSDGDNFTKYTGNPILSSGNLGTWDDAAIAYPSVIYDAASETFRMWYAGYDGKHFRIGYATAPLDPTVSIKDEEIILAESVILNQNYPNPFNPTTTISYSLPEQSIVKLTVYDIRGQEVATLQDGSKPPGNYDAQWNGVDRSGNPVTTGVYFARLQAGNYTQTIKMVFLR